MLDFLYDLGCTFTLFVLVVFMEGVIATRKNAKWTGLILSAVLLIISVFVGAYMHDLGAFLFLLIPVVLCLAACYAFGTVWFMAVYAKTAGAVGLVSVLSWCVFPFIIPDLIKLAMALLLGKRVKKSMRVLQ